MTTLLRARMPIANSKAAGPVLFADPIPATAQWNFSASRAASVVDQTGNGHAFTDIGRPSWTDSGMQVANASIGVATDVAEQPSMTYVAVCYVPSGVGIADSSARPIGTLRGFGAAAIGASINLVPRQSSNNERLRADLGTGTATVSTPELADTYDNRVQLRWMALSIDAQTGRISFVVPRIDWREQAVTVNNLANRPLNGNVLIGAFSNAGDGGQQGACVIRRAKVWQGVALNYAQLMADYRLALQDFALLGIAV